MEKKKIPIGWDIHLTKKQFYLSKSNLNKILFTASLPYLYHVYLAASNARKNKIETGKIKLDSSDIIRIGLVDGTLTLVGLSFYYLAHQRGYKFVPRFA